MNPVRKPPANSAPKEICIDIGTAVLEGTLVLPPEALAIVLFAHGSGSSRHSSRNRYVAQVLQSEGIGTLLFDLLTGDEEAIDQITAELRFDIRFLADRLYKVTRWLMQRPDTKHLRFGYFGASTGAAAALVAAAELRGAIRAIVSRGGRPDLAGDALNAVTCPTLLIVGEKDQPVIRMNQAALSRLSCEKSLIIIPHATHLFEEAGALEEVARIATQWFKMHLTTANPLRGHTLVRT
jgi:putative phosphoribosyl transferase